MKSYNKFLLILVIGLFFITSEANALWPTLDISSIKESITNTVEQVKQSKFVMDATATAGKMSAAIGDAKASVSKFAGDKIKDAKEKAEKLKAEKEKIEEKKREIEEKKREIEEKKAEMEDYKRQAEEAKNAATDKINEAKSTVADAKEIAGSAGDIANAKLNSATGGAVSLPSGGGGSDAGASSFSSDDAYDDSYDSYAPTSAAKDYGSDAALSADPAAEPTTETAPAEQEAAPAETAEDIVIDKSGDTLFDNAEAPVTPAAAEAVDRAVESSAEVSTLATPVAASVAKTEAPATTPAKRFRESPTVRPAATNAPVTNVDAVASDRFRDTSATTPRVEAVSTPIAEQEVSKFRTKDTSAREAVQEQLKAIPSTAPANSGFRKRPQLNKTLNTSSLFYRNSTPLVFAQGVVSLEESDFIAEGDHEGKFIFAAKLSEECKILPTDLSDPKAMNDCLKKLLCCMHSSDRAKSEDCKATYSIIVMQTNKALTAEAMKLKLDSASYKVQVAEPQADDMASASQVRDDLNNIAQTTSQQQMLLNTMASSLSSQLSNEALSRFPGMDKAAFVGYCEE